MIKTFNKRVLVFIAAFVALLLLCITLFAGCNGSKQGDFSAWNESAPTLSALKSYVQTVSDKNSSDYIPPEERIACFDMDGVIYCETAPVTGYTYLYAYRVLDDPDFKDKATDKMKELAKKIVDAPTNKTSEDAIWVKEGLTEAYYEAFSGLTLDQYIECIDKFIASNVPYYNNATYGDLIYQPMVQVIKYLNDNGFTCFVNTGSDRFTAREALKGKVDVKQDNILGADIPVKASGQGDKQNASYVIQNTDKIMLGNSIESNINANKVYKNISEIGKTPCIVFGNSSSDTSMFTYSQANCKYKFFGAMVLADDADREVNPATSKVEKYKGQWEKAGYNTISTKDDYKTLFGSNITKK